jgi:fumarate hydratase class II
MTSTEELNTEEFRIEHDTMGEVRVPVNALYRAQTQRAVENFPISGKTLERAHIEALARVKKAAAQANAELGVLDGELAQAIADAADEVATACAADRSTRPTRIRAR